MKAKDFNVVFCQMAPWEFAGERMNLRRTYRRISFAVNRVLSNMGVEMATPVLERFSKPVGKGEERWMEGLYVDRPQEWDDPYRFFRW